MGRYQVGSKRRVPCTFTVDQTVLDNFDKLIPNLPRSPQIEKVLEYAIAHPDILKA